MTKINRVITEDKIYRQEGLTITELSETVQEKEYLVRKAINTEMEFSNFNQFLNYYRIVEAQEMIKNNADLSMKEIAFHLGYPSPSSFNRAFKKETEMTPSVINNP